LIVISAVADSNWAIEDCSLAAENLMLAASAEGLGTCWIGFAQSWLGIPDDKAALNLTSTNMPIAPIIVGHPKAATASGSQKRPENQLDFIGIRQPIKRLPMRQMLFRPCAWRLVAEVRTPPPSASPFQN
jgi:hypothetical protein